MDPTNAITPWDVISYGFAITCFTAVILFSFGAWAADVIGATFRKAATAAVLVAAVHVTAGLIAWGTAWAFIDKLGPGGMQNVSLLISAVESGARIVLIRHVYETQWNKAVLLWLLHAGCAGFITAMVNLIF